MISFLTSTFICQVQALEVDKNELQNIDDQTIIFQNYVGPHTKIDSAAQIRQIGINLGNVIKKDPEKATVAGSPDRYYVIHAVDLSQTEKLDADIFFIGKKATVDHIDNIRRIISAYLISAYNYSSKDAQTLATFITVYNAVYRGKLDIYKEKYKQIVTKNLSSNCGIAINYEDWPGKSELVIPLSDIKNGGLSTVDTSVISDKEVVKSMQKDDDKNIDERKNMVDIKEREATTAADEAEKSQKQATVEQKKLVEEKKTLTEKKKEAAKAQKIAEKKPDDKKAQETAKEKQQEVVKQEEVVKDQTKKAEETKQKAAAQQDKSDKKQAEAQEERSTIADDQQKIIAEKKDDKNLVEALGLKLVDKKSLLSRMVQMDAKTGKELKESPVSVIRGRTLLQADKNYIAIAGENKGNAAIKLVLLDPDTMEIVKESNEAIAPDSVLIQDKNSYYCIINLKKNWFLGKYSSDLTLLLSSKIEVSEGTPISFSDSGIIVTDIRGNVQLLDKKTLELITDK